MPSKKFMQCSWWGRLTGRCGTARWLKCGVTRRAQWVKVNRVNSSDKDTFIHSYKSALEIHLFPRKADVPAVCISLKYATSRELVSVEQPLFLLRVSFCSSQWLSKPMIKVKSLQKYKIQKSIRQKHLIVAEWVIDLKDTSVGALLSMRTSRGKGS